MSLLEVLAAVLELPFCGCLFALRLDACYPPRPVCAHACGFLCGVFVVVVVAGDFDPTISQLRCRRPGLRRIPKPRGTDADHVKQCLLRKLLDLDRCLHLAPPPLVLLLLLGERGFPGCRGWRTVVVAGVAAAAVAGREEGRMMPRYI